MLTIILNYNQNLDNTLKSINFPTEILIGNIGNHFDYPYKSIKLSLNNDRSKACNELVKSAKDWIFYLKPGEVVLEANFDDLNINFSYFVEILTGNVITKETRLWHKSKNLQFVNPIFEVLHDNSIFSGITLSADPEPLDLDLLENWKKTHPFSHEPYYFEALYKLKEKKYQEFLTLADYYLFKEKTSVAAVMLCYYVSIVHCFVTLDYDQAINNLIYCLGENVLMAEFWCLLGDIYSQLKEDKAILFYENASILGKRRLKTDPFPIIIDKY